MRSGRYKSASEVVRAGLRLIQLRDAMLEALRRGIQEGISVDRLFNVLNRLGHDVEVRILAEEHAPEETRMFVTLG